jgi:hydrogenase maturation protein HypF
MKNCLCLAWGERVVVSPHIGELDSARGLDTLARVAEDLQRLYQIRARRLLLDRHPGYGYRAWARAAGLPMHEVWHHHAHAAALAGEHPQVGDWILFTWDGVGLGPDGSLWGGEALYGRPGAWRRRASFRPVRLPGGDKAGRAPWRSAAALLWEDASRIDAGRMDDDPVLPDSLSLSRNEREQLPLLRQAWRRGINSPVSTAAGRLFDAASALLGLGAHASFEGEGPMRLEALAGMSACAPRRGSGLLEPDLQLPLLRDDTGVWRSDWSPLIPMLTDAALTRDERAYRFHASLAGCLLQQADKLRAETGCQDVGLAGGVFQNRLLTELAVAGLEAAGFRVHLGERIPINDAGVSYGQILEFLHGT